MTTRWKKPAIEAFSSLASSKGQGKMKDQTEAKIAWVLWELFTDLTNLLWDRYEQQFLDFILNEQFPTKKAQKTTEKFMTGQLDDEMPF